MQCGKCAISFCRRTRWNESFSVGHKGSKAQRMKEKLLPLSAKEEFIAKEIVDAAYMVHKSLGPGLLERIYEVCFCHELTKRGLRLDVLVEELIICELKAVDQVNPIWEAQILSHLKLTGMRLGFLINFNTPVIRDGIKRYIR